jgi:hypothetical protein
MKYMLIVIKYTILYLPLSEKALIDKLWQMSTECNYQGGNIEKALQDVQNIQDFSAKVNHLLKLIDSL